MVKMYIVEEEEQKLEDAINKIEKEKNKKLVDWFIHDGSIGLVFYNEIKKEYEIWWCGNKYSILEFKLLYPDIRLDVE